MGVYRLSANAESDLYRIWLYGVQNFGEARADQYYNTFFERFEKLAQNPYSYPAVEHIREGYRRSVCGSDSIYYRIVGDDIEIMNILGRQDIGNL